MSIVNTTTDVLVCFKYGGKGMRTLNIYPTLLDSFVEVLPSLRKSTELNMYYMDSDDFNKLDNISSIRSEVDKLTNYKFDSEFDILGMNEGETLEDYYKRLYKHVVDTYKKSHKLYTSDIIKLTDDEYDDRIMSCHVMVSEKSSSYQMKNDCSTIFVKLEIASFEPLGEFADSLYMILSRSIKERTKELVKMHNDRLKQEQEKE